MCLILMQYCCGYRYDVVVEVAPEVKWVPEDGYKNLKVVVELDSEIEAKTAAERELKRLYKILSTMRIVKDRGLQVLMLYLYSRLQDFIL